MILCVARLRDGRTRISGCDEDGHEVDFYVHPDEALELAELLRGSALEQLRD